MKELMPLVAIAIFAAFFCLPSVQAVTNIGNCGTLEPNTEYAITGDFSNSSLVCFVLQNNTRIDFASHSATLTNTNGAFTNTEKGIVNFTVQDGTITLLSNGGRGIGFSTGGSIANSTLLNMNFNCSMDAPYVNCIDFSTAVSMPFPANNLTMTNVNVTGGAKAFETFFDNATIKNSFFQGKSYAIWFNALAENNYGCNITMKPGNLGTLVDWGSNNYITSDVCQAGNLRYWELHVKVLSLQLYNNATCPNITDATVNFGGITQTNATLFNPYCCWVNGYQSCYMYNFTHIEEGTHNLSISRAGYKPYSELISLTKNTEIEAVLVPQNVGGTLTVIVNNATNNPIGGAECKLYYANGSVFASTNPIINQNPQYSYEAGFCEWISLPIEAYFFEVRKESYGLYRSPVFILSEDKTFTIYLTRTNKIINLQLNTICGYDANKNWNCTANNNYNFTVSFTNFSMPVIDAMVYIQTPTQSHYKKLPYISGNYSFIIEGKDKWFDVGTNKVFIAYDQYLSNIVTVEIKTTEYLPEGGITGGSYVNLPIAGASWISLLFTPFTIITFTLIGIAAYIENLVKSHGAVFMISIIIGIMAFSALGLYPVWVGAIIIILTSFVFAWWVKSGLFK